MEHNQSVPQEILVTIWQGGVPRTVTAARGQGLKALLLEEGGARFSKFHCGGMGICGTCKIQVKEEGEWWERRACQLRCFHSLEIQVE